MQAISLVFEKSNYLLLYKIISISRLSQSKIKTMKIGKADAMANYHSSKKLHMTLIKKPITISKY